MTGLPPPESFLLSHYDYHLPDNLIAQAPAIQRDASRLLVLEKKTGFIRHCRFSDLPEFLGPDDLLILNETRVRPARLEGKKHPSGGRVSVLLLKNRNSVSWEALVRGNPRVNQEIEFSPEIRAVVRENLGGGKQLLEFRPIPDLMEKLEEIGLPPLPPYIRRPPGDEDRARYQTVYAKQSGSLAAPTAGLHFTGEVLEEIKKNGTEIQTLTLHVGTGTFLPVRAEDIRNHRMESESYNVPTETIRALNEAEKSGRRVVAVGTTSTRVLESLPALLSAENPISGQTDLFIYPGFSFKRVDSLLTNFHLPRSTLLILVSAFAGEDNIRVAYREAVEKKYRFFSFGDVMLIL